MATFLNGIIDLRKQTINIKFQPQETKQVLEIVRNDIDVGISKHRNQNSYDTYFKHTSRNNI